MTIRPRGHWEFLKDHVLYRRDADQVMEDIFLPVSAANPDKVYLQIQKGYKRIPTTWTWKYDSQHNISAMAQATGYVVGAVATMIHDQLLPTRIVGMHEVNFDEIVKRAKLMPDQFIEV
jgi:hypothetical protein